MGQCSVAQFAFTTVLMLHHSDACNRFVCLETFWFPSIPMVPMDARFKLIPCKPADGFLKRAREHKALNLGTRHNFTSRRALCLNKQPRS